MWLRKIVVALCITSLVAVGSMALAGCGKSDEETVRESITAELESAKNLDQEFVDAFGAEIEGNLSEFEDYGVSSADIVNAWLGGFDYTVDEVTVDDEAKTATATVSVTGKTLTDLMKAVTKSLKSLTKDEDAITGADDTDALIAQTIIDAMNNVEPTEKDAITVEYTFENNAWTPTTSVASTLSNALLA